MVVPKTSVHVCATGDVLLGWSLLWLTGIIRVDRLTAFLPWQLRLFLPTLESKLLGRRPPGQYQINSCCVQASIRLIPAVSEIYSVFSNLIGALGRQRGERGKWSPQRKRLNKND